MAVAAAEDVVKCILKVLAWIWFDMYVVGEIVVLEPVVVLLEDGS